MGEQNQKPHAIMIAFPYQGHIIPLVNLALKLASKGFAITFVHTEFSHHLIAKAQPDSTIQEADFFANARESGLDIRYMVMSDGLPLEYDRNLNAEEYWEYIVEDFPAVVEEFVGKIGKSDEPLASFLVTDTLYSWPARVAKKYNLVNVSFWTQPAMVFAINWHLDLLRENGHLPLNGNHGDNITYIPGVRTISTRDLMAYLQSTDITTPLHKLTFEAFDAAKKADFVLCNTVQELEPETLQALNQKLPTYAIGPISFPTDLTSPTVTTSIWPESDCSKWLDTKPPGSVLYVSFGSIVQTNKKVIEEIAHGLLLSQISFIWAVRPQITGSNDSTILPTGFENDVEGHGLIVPWCKQIDVLSHPAVGGFISHCGWNSIVESIWCGVPIICYPLFFEQPSNRKLLVHDWEIGINLCDVESVTRQEVAEKVKSLMSGETSDRLRPGIKKRSKILHCAVEKDGSSERNFDLFVEDVKAKIFSKSKSARTS